MSAATSHRGFGVFAAALLLTLTFRLWLAVAMPITGDEAYFYYWGSEPDWGFYDHPPMVGWWLAVLQWISGDPWLLRLPAVLLPAVTATACGLWLRRDHPQSGWLVALIVLLAPAAVWNVFITTDTPLAYFSFFAAMAFIRAARDDDGSYYLLAGLLLGGAFLSKYFAVFLGLAFAAHCLYRPSRAKLAGLGLVLLGALPAGLLNAWWNSEHCWANIMFNVFNRNSDAGLSWKTPLLYAVMMLYLLTPPVIWTLARYGRGVVGRAGAGGMQAMAWIGLLPLALFGLLSLVKTVGLHWVLSFLPFVFMLPAGAAPPRALRVSAGFAVLLAAVHMLVIVVMANLPLESWRGSRLYDGIVMTFRADALLARLATYENDYAFATDGYSPSVTMGFNARRYFFVFGEASSHARHDDILTDFRSLAGRNILVLRKDAADPAQYEPYFDSVSYQSFEVEGARFYLVLGRGFRYEPYRERVLTELRRRFYAVPSWLPMRACYFCDRYFPGTQCRPPR